MRQNNILKREDSAAVIAAAYLMEARAAAFELVHCPLKDVRLTRQSKAGGKGDQGKAKVSKNWLRNEDFERLAAGYLEAVGGRLLAEAGRTPESRSAEAIIEELVARLVKADRQVSWKREAVEAALSDLDRRPVEKAGEGPLASDRQSAVGLSADCGSVAFLVSDFSKAGLTLVSQMARVSPETRVLRLSANRLRDVDGLPQLPNLVLLDLSANRINRLSLSQPFEALDALNLESNRLGQLRLPSLPNLSTLNLRRNRLFQLELTGLASLETLELRANKLAKLDFLTACPFLRELYAADNQIDDVSGIEGCQSLRRAHLRKNAIGRFQVPSRLPLLEYLNLRENRLASIDGILEALEAGRLGSLKSLNVIGNPAVEEESEELLQRVRRFKQVLSFNKSETAVSPA